MTEEKKAVNKKHEWFRLGKKPAQFILVYLLLIGLISIVLLVSMLIKETNPFPQIEVFSTSIIYSIAASLIGSSIYYSRKMYKACINLDMIKPNGDGDEIREIGVIYYYISRPLYSACLGVIACVALRSGTELITKDGAINNNFPYLILIVAFFVGYSSADFIDSLEAKGKQVVQGVFSSDPTNPKAE
jgi:hypothetical protein